ncbi:MAG: hypothetical protein HY741_24920 [Chloroflexi bacterium]|nr:hypothetical protein [Chloroflexota bacterium]
MRIPLSPYDTVPTALLRFVLELVALFLIGAAFGVINFLISVAAISLFNAKGDKRFVGIQVSGPVRLMIEIVIALMGIYSAGLAFGGVWMLGLGVVWALYLFLARERLLWLAQGAKDEG